MERLLFSLCATVCIQLIAAYRSFTLKIPNVGTTSRVPAPVSLVNGAPGLTCHSIGHVAQCGGPPSGGGNPFGKTFHGSGQVWNEVVCRTDSDKDGYTNGEELGDPHCRWTEANPTTLITTNLSHPGFSCSTPQNPYCKGTAPPVPADTNDGSENTDSKPSWRVAMTLSLLIGVIKLALTIVNELRSGKDRSRGQAMPMSKADEVGGTISYVNAGFDKDQDSP